MRKITFTSDSFREYNDWIAIDVEMVKKIQLMLRDIQNDPFKGLGKPEPLKGNILDFGAEELHKNTGLFIGFLTTTLK